MKEANFDQLDIFLEQKHANPDLKKVAKKLYEIILSTNDDLEAAIKWNRVIFAINNDFHHWICGINVTKKNISLIFHFGCLLTDENNILMVASSKFFRKVEIKNCQQINEEGIRLLILQAINKLPFFIENWKELNKKE